MNDRQIVRAALKRNGITQPALSEMLGYKRETVGTILKGKSIMGVDKFFRMLSALGYEIAVRKKDGTDKTEFILADNEKPIDVDVYIDTAKINKAKSEIEPPERK